MRPLWLDYQQAMPGRRRNGVMVLLLGLGVGAALMAEYTGMAAESEDLQYQVARLRRDADQARRAGTEEGKATAPGEAAASTGHSNAAWEGLFAALEAAAGEEVTLLALQPGPREIQISGEAKDLATAMDYLGKLQGSRALTNVHLTQSGVVEEHPQHPLRFTLAAEWRESGS
jgi:hypothetical protein